MGTQSRRAKVKRSDPAAKLPQETPARDEEILQAAFDVFTEKGFHGARMLDVASRARASKATLYARYPSKEALFEALMAWSTRQGTEALDTMAADETLDPLAALHRLAAQLLALMLQPKKLALFRIAVAEGDRLSAVGRSYSAFTSDRGAAGEAGTDRDRRPRRIRPQLHRTAAGRTFHARATRHDPHSGARGDR